MGHTDLDGLLEALLDRVCQFLRVDTVAVLLIDDDAGALVARAARGLEEEVEHGFSIPLGKGFAGRVAAERRPIVIEDVELADIVNPLLREKNIRSLLGVPLVVDDNVLGVLHVGTLARREFGEPDIQLLQRVADRSALAIERARLFEAEQKAHAAAEAARVEADRANLIKSKFLSRMSHELRTPLNAILGFGQLLELDGLEDRQRDHVEHILKAGRHLLELINEVLDISRIEAGELTLSPEAVVIAEAVQEVIALVQPLAAQQGVRLGLDTRGLDGHAYVHADRQRLRQVLLNLLANAIKYNRAGGRVDVSFDLPDDEHIRTLVSDTGMGIDSDQLAGLFEPFERLGAELGEVEGTGLGLALSKGLTEAMGGSLAVTSEPGRGSTFTVELGVAAPPDSGEAAEVRPQEMEEIGSGLEPGHHRILYIEDNLANLTLVERILDRHPAIELIPAMQGRLGLELAREHGVDLIVLDLHLPDMSGAEVLRRLKADPVTHAIPVVVLSADAGKKQLQRLVRLGASDYLTKPLDVKGFLDVVGANLDADER